MYMHGECMSSFLPLFASNLSYIYLSGSGSVFRYGFIMLLNTDPIWIWIHNTALLVLLLYSWLQVRGRLAAEEGGAAAGR